MRKFFIFALIMTATMALYGQETNSFWDHGVGKMLKKFDNFLEKMERSGFDTNYVAVPERDRMVYVGGYGSLQRYDLHFPILLAPSDFPDFLQNYLPSNVSDMLYMEPRFRATSAELELGIDWRGLCIELPISLNDRYSKSFGLAKNGNEWGFRLKYKSVNNVSGRIRDPFVQGIDIITDRMVNDIINKGDLGENHDPIEAVERDIESGSMDLRMFYAEGYYVFNHRKFSLGAGMYGDMIQKRSAGSLIAMGNYFQSRLGCNNMLEAERDVFRNQIISLGLGYGYNLSLMNGQLCVHASVIPMFSLSNHVKHKSINPSSETEFEDMDPEYQQEYKTMMEQYYAHFYDGVNVARDSGFKVNGFARFAVNYSYDRFLLSLLMNYRQYLFGSSSGMKIDNREGDLQINIGYRF